VKSCDGLKSFLLKHPDGQPLMSFKTSLNTESVMDAHRTGRPVSLTTEENHSAVVQAVVQSP